MSELIIAPDAPSVAGPYSPGLVVGDRIFLSGQGGFDPDTGELVSDTIADQTTRAFRNVEALLRVVGASLDDVVSCLVHLRDLAQFDEFNASYTQQFPSRVKPVRTTVGCDLSRRNARRSDSGRPEARPQGERCHPHGQVRKRRPLPPFPRDPLVPGGKRGGDDRQRILLSLRTHP